MLGVGYFSHHVIRKYVNVFGDLFNDIVIHRFDSSGARIQIIPVPIAYGPVAKHVALEERNPITNKTQVQLPRMAFQLDNIVPALGRKINPINKNTLVHNPTTMKTQFVPVPYDFNFTLNIYTKSYDDAAQITGQILPFFQPDFTPTVNVIPEMNVKYDTKVELVDVQIQDEFEGTVDEPRMINWILSFKMNAYFFGPVTTQGVIKRAIVDFIPVPGSGSILDDDLSQYGRKSRIIVTPGLTSDGQPTSNSSNSIPYSEIEADDPYGFITQFDTFEDNLKYDPESGQDKPI